MDAGQRGKRDEHAEQALAPGAEMQAKHLGASGLAGGKSAQAEAVQQREIGEQVEGGDDAQAEDQHMGDGARAAV